jgi:hypothetical protein
VLRAHVLVERVSNFVSTGPRPPPQKISSRQYRDAARRNRLRSLSSSCAVLWRRFRAPYERLAAACCFIDPATRIRPVGRRRPTQLVPSPVGVGQGACSRGERPFEKAATTFLRLPAEYFCISPPLTLLPLVRHPLVAFLASQTVPVTGRLHSRVCHGDAAVHTPVARRAAEHRA